MKIENAQIEIYSLIGNKIETQIDQRTQIANGNREIAIDIAGFSSGIYFVKLNTEMGIAVQKLIVQ